MQTIASGHGIGNRQRTEAPAGRPTVRPPFSTGNLDVESWSLPLYIRTQKKGFLKKVSQRPVVLILSFRKADFKDRAGMPTPLLKQASRVFSCKISLLKLKEAFCFIPQLPSHPHSHHSLYWRVHGSHPWQDFLLQRLINIRWTRRASIAEGSQLQGPRGTADPHPL